MRERPFQHLVAILRVFFLPLPPPPTPSPLTPPLLPSFPSLSLFPSYPFQHTPVRVDSFGGFSNLAIGVIPANSGWSYGLSGKWPESMYHCQLGRLPSYFKRIDAGEPPPVVGVLVKREDIGEYQLHF